MSETDGRNDGDSESYLYLIVAGCPNCGEVVHLVEETDAPVNLMQEVPITANCCRHCGGMVHEWDVHEDAEIERVTPTQEREMIDDKDSCPEPHCGISMQTRDELNAHLRWDHNRSDSEAEAMLDAAGVGHAE